MDCRISSASPLRFRRLHPGLPARLAAAAVVALACLTSTTPATAADDATAKRRPNIVMILADDKYAEVGRHTAVLRIITGFMAETT
jgi:hypothetical protein